jgi:hypothetical protein
MNKIKLSLALACILAAGTLINTQAAAVQIPTPEDVAAAPDDAETTRTGLGMPPTS